MDSNGRNQEEDSEEEREREREREMILQPAGMSVIAVVLEF